jgi:hypothetical protein
LAVRAAQEHSSSPALPPGHPDEFVGSDVSPIQQVGIILRRKKAQGIDVEWSALWQFALTRCRYEHDRVERHTSKEVLAWAEPYFHAAWDGEPMSDRLALAIALLAPLLAEQREQEL